MKGEEEWGDQCVLQHLVSIIDGEPDPWEEGAPYLF